MHNMCDDAECCLEVNESTPQKCFRSAAVVAWNPVPDVTAITVPEIYIKRQTSEANIVYHLET